MPDESLVRFRRVVTSALAELENRRQEVNDLNVFPVADGDTGDNMALTLRAVLDELDQLSSQGLVDDIGRDEIERVHGEVLDCARSYPVPGIETAAALA